MSELEKEENVCGMRPKCFVWPTKMDLGWHGRGIKLALAVHLRGMSNERVNSLWQVQTNW